MLKKKFLFFSSLRQRHHLWPVRRLQGRQPRGAVQLHGRLQRQPVDRVFESGSEMRRDVPLRPGHRVLRGALQGQQGLFVRRDMPPEHVCDEVRFEHGLPDGNDRCQKLITDKLSGQSQRITLEIVWIKIKK